jgi:hypothetical protein
MIKPHCFLKNLWKLVLLWTLTGGAWAEIAIGSVVMYSDGRVEKLLSREDGKRLWEDDRKRRFLRSENPIVPVLERKDFLSGKGYTQFVAGGNPNAIAARPGGEAVEFSMRRVRNNARGGNSVRRWKCVYNGVVKQNVLGAVRVLGSYACERFVYHRKTWQPQFRESRHFLYSDDLGIVVDMKRKTRKTRSSWKLVSVIPPEKAGYKRLSENVRKLRGRE